MSNYCLNKQKCNFIIILSSLSFLYLVNNSIISKLGFMFIIISFCLLIYLFFLKVIKDKIQPIHVIYFLFIFVCLINLTISFSSKALYVFFQEILLMMIPTIAIGMKINESTYSYLIKKIKIEFVVLMLLSFLIKYIFKDINVIISTTFLKALFGMSLFFLLDRSFKGYITILVISLSFFLLGERTAAMLLLIGTIVNYLYRKIKISKNTFMVMIIVFLLIVVFFAHIYIDMKYSSFGDSLNQFTKQLTGEYFFSGRDRIWEAVLDKINYFHGSGLGNDVLLEEGITFSSHNLYLYLLLEGGLPTLFLFICFFYFIFMKIRNGNKTFVIMVMLILILLDFELLLLVNNMPVSIWLWLIISFSLLDVVKNNKNSLISSDENEETKNNEV